MKITRRRLKVQQRPRVFFSLSSQSVQKNVDSDNRLIIFAADKHFGLNEKGQRVLGGEHKQEAKIQWPRELSFRYPWGFFPWPHYTWMSLVASESDTRNCASESLIVNPVTGENAEPYRGASPYNAAPHHTLLS